MAFQVAFRHTCLPKPAERSVSIEGMWEQLGSPCQETKPTSPIDRPTPYLEWCLGCPGCQNQHQEGVSVCQGVWRILSFRNLRMSARVARAQLRYHLCMTRLFSLGPAEVTTLTKESCMLLWSSRGSTTTHVHPSLATVVHTDHKPLTCIMGADDHEGICRHCRPRFFPLNYLK